jgi:hypothetical protein
MGWVTAIGTLLGGIGLLFLSFGVFQRVALLEKEAKSAKKDE